MSGEINERPGAITMYGKPLTLLGPALQLGDSAPHPPLVANDLSIVVLGDAWGRARIINCIPSIDTPVCDRQTRHFDQLVSDLTNPPELVTVSVDLPFAQRRYHKEHDLKHQLLSAYRDEQFGIAFGVLIKELRLLARAVFVVDPGGAIAYVEYVSELATQPDYQAAIEAAAKLA